MPNGEFYIDCHRMTVPENILLQKSTADYRPPAAACVYRQTNRSAQQLTLLMVCFTISVNKAISTISKKIFHKFYAKVCSYFNIGPISPLTLLVLRRWPRIYTVAQKKRTNFLLCASLLYLTETGEFFTYINERKCYNSVYLISACVKNFA